MLLDFGFQVLPTLGWQVLAPELFCTSGRGDPLLRIFPDNLIDCSFRNSNIDSFKRFLDFTAGQILGTQGQNGRLRFRTNSRRHFLTTTDEVNIFRKSFIAKLKIRAEMTYLITKKSAKSETTDCPGVADPPSVAGNESD